MNHDALRDQLEAYALGLLEVEEQEQVDRHLAECPECRLELENIQEQLSWLPDALVAASSEYPPAAAKDRLLRTIQPDQAGSAQPLSVAPGQRMRNWWTPARMAAVIALVALAVSVGWGLRLNQALSEERELRARIAGLVDQQEIVFEIVDGGDTERRILRPPNGADADTYGKVFTRPEFREVVIMAARLPDAPEDMAYHVWLTTGDRNQLAGRLKVNEEGFGLLVVEGDEAGPEYSLVLITVQRVGSTQPDGVTVLTWEETPA